MPATVARDAVVAGERLVADDIEHPQTVGQSPGLCLVEPHERRMDAELFLHGQVESDVETLHEVVSAIGITAEVGLPHAGHQIHDAVIAGIDSRHTEEEEVASGHEGAGPLGAIGLLLLDGHGGVGEAATALTQLGDEAHIHALPLYARLGSQLLGQLDFLDVLLAIGKAQCTHRAEMLLGPI